MVIFESMPTKESMKQPIRRRWYYYGDMPISRPKNTEDVAQYFWYINKGQKPHSNCWGRKPYWRKKRREQKRAKREMRNALEAKTLVGKASR